MVDHLVEIDGLENAPWLSESAHSLLGIVATRPEFSRLGSPLELSLLLTDDAEIRVLNQRWRKIDAPTDVLSFPLDEGATLGDIAISMETAARRVREPEWSLQDEVLFLLIHGLLHLVGHDHEEAEERRVMEAAEQEIWTAMGQPGTLRPADEPETG
ncbi:MAG: rRNA maturation RNase YbeY [Myxococcota bacterium]|nr:rRNA maturation RNase YbeY [Myxococcota bacterium]